jgi:hypothetical protein
VNVWSNDLKFAMTTRVIVDAKTLDGAKFFTGVESVDNDAGVVTLFDQRTMGGPAGKTRVRMDDITSLTVTEIAHSMSLTGE